MIIFRYRHTNRHCIIIYISPSSSFLSSSFSSLSSSALSPHHQHRTKSLIRVLAQGCKLKKLSWCVDNINAIASCTLIIVAVIQSKRQWQLTWQIYHKTFANFRDSFYASKKIDVDFRVFIVVKLAPKSHNKY